MEWTFIFISHHFFNNPFFPPIKIVLLKGKGQMHPIKLKNEMGDSAIKSEYVFAQFVNDILLLMIM
jgi:hypothetical protein